MARVVIEHLSKVFPASRKSEPFIAVRDLNLEAKDGELLVLVGPSGCGKSTTLRLIAGLEDVSSGTIRIGDQVVNQVEPKDRDIAMVFQNYALYPHMTVYENMAFGLQLRKVPRKEINDRVGVAADMLGLGALLERLPRALSGGQRQRVAVGRAIVRKPKVFLFDEPLSNLDAQMRLQMRTELSRLHQQLRATMIYVTHDQAEAMTLGDRIAVLHQGELQQAADPITLYQNPANRFVAGFMGSPAMNLISGRLSPQAGKVWFTAALDGGGTAPLRFPIPDFVASAGRCEAQDLLVGVRPEHLTDRLVPGSIEFTGQVDLVELLGAETLVHVSNAGCRWIARLPSLVRPELGCTVSFYSSIDHFRFFDPKSGLALS